MSIEDSRQYLMHRTGWVIDESTFAVLDETLCVWMARVTTSHNIARGEPNESTFTILVNYFEYIKLEDNALPTLKSWVERNVQ